MADAAAAGISAPALLPPPDGSRIEVGRPSWSVSPWRVATVIHPPGAAPALDPSRRRPEERDSVIITGGDDRGVRGELVCIDGNDAIVRTQDDNFIIVNYADAAAPRTTTAIVYSENTGNSDPVEVEFDAERSVLYLVGSGQESGERVEYPYRRIGGDEGLDGERGEGARGRFPPAKKRKTARGQNITLADDAGAGDGRASLTLRDLFGGDGDDNDNDNDNGESDGRTRPRLPPMCNDEGAAVSQGLQEVGRFFCGQRKRGQHDSNSRTGAYEYTCGPSGGKQCESCARFQSERRLDVMRRRFGGDSIDDKALVAALRRSGGSYIEAAHYLTRVIKGRSKKNSGDDTIEELQKSHGMFVPLASGLPAEGVLVDSGDCDGASKDNRGMQNTMEEKQRLEDANETKLETNGVDGSLPETVITHGHRMVLVAANSCADGAGGDAEGADERKITAKKPIRCPLCSCVVPHDLSGRYRCSACHLCEGCVRTGAITWCPSLANGTPHHHHPLSYVGCLDRDPRAVSTAGAVAPMMRWSRSCHFDHVGKGCLVCPVAWRCPSCVDFAVCAVCIARPPLEGYGRRFCRVVDNGGGDGGGDESACDLFDTSSDEGGEHGSRPQGADAVPNAQRAETVADGCNDDRTQFIRTNNNESSDNDNDNAIAGDISRRIEERHGLRQRTTSDAGSIDNDGPHIVCSFEDAAAHRAIASRWQGGTAVESRSRGADSDSHVMVGSGVVGASDRLRSRPNSNRSDDLTDSESDEELFDVDADAPPLPEGARLTSDSARALEQFQSSGNIGGGDSNRGTVVENADGRGKVYAEEEAARECVSPSDVVPATDLDHVESILRLAQSVDDRLTRRALLNAIAAGRLGIAGALLMSRSFAPSAASTRSPSSQGEGDEEVEGEGERDRVCYCGDPIDFCTAPDGAVGCMNGHAIHASCAVDLLLGGGSCPTCRQPLFFSRVGEREARAAALRHREEEEDRRRRMQREEGLAVGDVVRIDSDVDACRRTQIDGDPLVGGWSECMSEACGMEGHVTAVLKGRGELSSVIAVRVRFRWTDHAITRGWGRSACRTCPRSGNSYQKIWRLCWRCQRCHTCCENSECDSEQCEWTWNSSLLTLVNRACNEILDKAAKKAEQHMERLQAELRAVKAAREAVKADMEMQKSESGEPLLSPSVVSEVSRVSDDTGVSGKFPLRPSPMNNRKRELTAQSSAAVSALSSQVSPAQWQRAHHLLLLARQWGDSEKARAKRATLYSLVRAGELDTVARTIRRYNAARVADEARWIDAIAGTREYIVEPSGRVELRAYPKAGAPRTGYVLEAKTRFRSKREIVDDDGNHWLQIGECSIRKENSRDFDESFTDVSRKATEGTRVQRGKGWNSGNEDGGKGNEGIIVSVEDDVFAAQVDVTVQWKATNIVGVYKVGGDDLQQLALVDTRLPPQGWLSVRPGGIDSPAIVASAKSAIRCCGCGDDLVPQKLGREKFVTVEGKAVDLKRGDKLLVAATLEPVFVESVVKSVILSVDDTRIFCIFPSMLVDWEDAKNILRNKASLREDSSCTEAGREVSCRSNIKKQAMKMAKEEVFLSPIPAPVILPKPELELNSETEPVLELKTDEDRLSFKEQEDLTESINSLGSEGLQGVIRIIRESTLIVGGEDDIDMEIDQLDTATQRKLQHFVMKNVKSPHREKGRAKQEATPLVSAPTSSFPPNAGKAAAKSTKETAICDVGLETSAAQLHVTHSVSSGNEKEIIKKELDMSEFSVCYRPCDLVFLERKKGQSLEGSDVRRNVSGQMLTRREVFLMTRRDEAAAKKMWNDAACADDKKDVSATNYASCVRGHLLHARCIQSALLAGRCCPAPGCTEPLWVPRIEKVKAREASCGMAGREAESEVEALRAASELPGHAAAVAARGERGAECSGEQVTTAGIEDLKMCPVCCAGPLFNENCSDMDTHHGECTTALLHFEQQGRSVVEECTENGTFKASAKEIAEKMTQISSSRHVTDLLPKCPKHNVLVMFNGCLNCGHLFTDTPWNHLPAWDPNAMLLLELDVKKRHGTRLLAEQVRKEAAMLQFERDSLWEARRVEICRMY